jgi:hypothetical protein
VVFVPGALIGILMPGILVSHVLAETGTEPTRASMPTYVAAQLEQMGEPRIWYWWALLVGFLILFTTQVVVFEMLVRNMVDALYGSSAGFRRIIRGDPRRFYYPFMVVLAIVISLIIFQALPTELVQWSANMSNLAALIMPLFLMYLISKLPRPAKANWWSYVVLIAMVIYFGFFFANFLTSQLTGGDLSFWYAEPAASSPLAAGGGDPLHEVALADEEDEQHGHGGDDAGGEDHLPLAFATLPELVEDHLEARGRVTASRRAGRSAAA